MQLSADNIYISNIENDQNALKRDSFPQGALSKELKTSLKTALANMSDKEFTKFWEKHKDGLHPKKQTLQTLSSWVGIGEHPNEQGTFTAIMSEELVTRQARPIKASPEVANVTSSGTKSSLNIAKA